MSVTSINPDEIKNTDRRSVQYIAITPDQLAEAIKLGFVAAIQSQEATDAFETAVTRWFDQQSGKAVRHLLSTIAIGCLLFIGINYPVVKSLFAWGK